MGIIQIFLYPSFLRLTFVLGRTSSWFEPGCGVRVRQVLPQEVWDPGEEPPPPSRGHRSGDGAHQVQGNLLIVAQCQIVFFYSSAVNLNKDIIFGSTYIYPIMLRWQVSLLFVYQPLFFCITLKIVQTFSCN